MAVLQWPGCRTGNDPVAVDMTDPSQSIEGDWKARMTLIKRGKLSTSRSRELQETWPQNLQNGERTQETSKVRQEADSIHPKGAGRESSAISARMVYT